LPITSAAQTKQTIETHQGQYMRYSKEHRANTHAKIVTAAATHFREKGIEGVGVASLMQTLGLTHGGFYAHFESKECLTEEALNTAFDQTLKRFKDYASQAIPGHKLRRLVDIYLSNEHRNDPGLGCFAAANASEITRQSEKIRQSVSKRLADFLDLIEDLANQDNINVDSRALLSMMTGGLLLSRIMTDDRHASEFLQATSNAINQLIKY
jgi:TetR/AcrR family transcriptional repressor of nem operon